MINQYLLCSINTLFILQVYNREYIVEYIYSWSPPQLSIIHIYGDKVKGKNYTIFPRHHSQACCSNKFGCLYASLFQLNSRQGKTDIHASSSNNFLKLSNLISGFWTALETCSGIWCNISSLINRFDRRTSSAFLLPINQVKKTVRK